MPRPVGPSSGVTSRPSFVSGSADTMERQIKKRKDDVYRQTLANLAKLEQEKQDDGGGFGVGDAFKAFGKGLGGLIVSPAATVLDTMDWANQQLEKYVAGKEPEDQYDPADAYSYNLFGETYRGVDAGLQRAGGDIAAIPGFGEPSASPTASDIRNYGVLEGVARAGIDYGNLAATVYPVAKPGVVKAVGTTRDLANSMKLARMDRELNPFPRITTPSSFIDVVEGSRLPARVADASMPATTQAALPPATRQLAPAPAYRTTRAALAEDMAVTAPDTPAPAGLASTAMQDLAQAQARNATHIGTVSRGPVEVISSQPFNELQSMGWFEGGLPNQGSTTMQQFEIPVYEIGGKKVAFGNTNINRHNAEMDLSGVEVVPLNPYEISKLSSASKEGQEMAMQFTDALNGRVIESLDQGASSINNNDQLQVFALQYAASKGDKVAAAELERLAKVGRELVTQQRLAEAQQQQQYVSQFLRGYNWESVPEMNVAIGRDATGTTTYRPIGIDDIFLVHQTRYKPPVDADGNVILNPASDFYMIDPETGKPYTDFVTGEPLPKPNRHTIHFALNHVVGGNMWRQTPDVDTFAIVVPLRDVLDANPGSLDNLFAVDTYFTPKPGEGLVLPMKSGKVVEIPGVNRYGSVGPTADTLERVAAEGKQIVADAMNDVGQAHNKYEEYQVRRFPDYETSSDEIVDMRMADLATGDIPKQYKEYGPKVEHGLHANSQIANIENAMFPGNEFSHWVWSRPTDSLGPNARLRLFDTNVFGSGQLHFANTLWEDGL